MRRRGHDYVRAEHVLQVLRYTAVLAEPETGRAKLETKEHDVIVLDEAKLREW